MHILGSMRCVLFQFFYNNKYTLLIMARSKQTYYGSCFVASYIYIYKVTIEKIWPIHYKKGPSKFSDMGPWAHTLLFLGNTLVSSNTRSHNYCNTPYTNIHYSDNHSYISAFSFYHKNLSWLSFHWSLLAMLVLYITYVRRHGATLSHKLYVLLTNIIPSNK